MKFYQNNIDTFISSDNLVYDMYSQEDYFRFIEIYEESQVDIHLQFFASEDEGKTFDPTERKIQKAREEGRVSKSPEIPSALILITVAALLWAIGRYYVDNLKNTLGVYFSRISLIGITGFNNEGLSFVVIMFRMMWPVVLLTIVMGILGNVMQFGWAPSLKPLTPDFSKVGFKVGKWVEKIVSVQGWYNTGMSIVKLAVVGMIVVINIVLRLDDITATLSQPFAEGLLLGIQLGFLILIESGMGLLLLGVLDYQFQRYLFMDQLKMTFKDVKDEFKESEGDQEVKRRIQSRMQEFMNRNVVKEVSESDVLITNPTHFAVALKYDQEVMDAPQVMAKGEDAYALRMRRIAKDMDVPIIENKPLARALYADLNIGDEIPEQYYKAVVSIFQEVYKIKGVYQ